MLEYFVILLDEHQKVSIAIYIVVIISFCIGNIQLSLKILLKQIFSLLNLFPELYVIKYGICAVKH
jgi:hypothetical protein